MHDDWTKEDDNWESDSEYEDYDDHQESDELDTVDCPYCGEAMFDDAPSCPHCGNYVTAEDRPPEPKPRWFVVAAWLCLLAASSWFYFLWAR